MKWTMQPLMMHEQDSDLPPEGYEVVDEAGQHIFDNQTYYPSPPTPEQAAHIVHCVNCHDELCAALKGLCDMSSEDVSEWAPEWDAAYAAIAKAQQAAP